MARCGAPWQSGAQTRRMTNTAYQFALSPGEASLLDEEDSAAAAVWFPPLEKLPPGPWRSLGGYLDYAQWEDRERFLQLDLAIQSEMHRMAVIQTEMSHAEATRTGTLLALLSFPPRMSRRCRAKLPHRGNCNETFYLTADYRGWRCASHRDPSAGRQQVRQQHAQG
jgi:hypothetical protein